MEQNTETTQDVQNEFQALMLAEANHTRARDERDRLRKALAEVEKDFCTTRGALDEAKEKYDAAYATRQRDDALVVVSAGGSTPPAGKRRNKKAAESIEPNDTESSGEPPKKRVRRDCAIRQEQILKVLTEAPEPMRCSEIKEFLNEKYDAQVLYVLKKMTSQGLVQQNEFKRWELTK